MDLTRLKSGLYILFLARSSNNAPDNEFTVTMTSRNVIAHAQYSNFSAIVRSLSATVMATNER